MGSLPIKTKKQTGGNMNKYTRRDFLKSAGLLGGGMMFAPSIFAQAVQPKTVGANSKLNIAMVGMGAQGEVLMNNLVKMPNINFAAICDIRPDRRRYGAARVRKISPDIVNHQYEDYKDLIANVKDLDAVFIATPDFWHSPQTVDFLNAGVNVYCEKMMSNTVEGARKMVQAARKSGKLLQIGHQRKSNPRYHYMRNKVIEELQMCGRITHANGQWNRAVAKDLELANSQKLPLEVLQKYGYENEHKFCNWRWYKGLGGGPISDLGAHQIDIFAWVFGGRPVSVMATGGVDFYEGKDWYDNVMCIYEYKDKEGFTARAFYQVLTTTSAGGGYYEQFMGTKGTAKFSENPALMTIYPEGYKPNSPVKELFDGYAKQGILRPPRKVTYEDDEPTAAVADARESPQPPAFRVPFTKYDTKELVSFVHLPHIENFFASIRGEAKLNCDGEHAFESEAAVYKIYEAIEAEKKIRFQDSDFIA